jgi:NAD(P)-dependent dehydrogenase (short-subunit alcohol dehydrogenase family)
MTFGSDHGVPDHAGTDARQGGMFSHRGRVVVITGGGTGIGLAAARAFVVQGAHVLVCGRREDVLKRAVVGIAAEASAGPAPHDAAPGTIASRTADVTRYQDLLAVADEAQTRWGALNVWMNAAGILERRPLPEADTDHLRRLFETNVAGVFNGCRVAVERMRETGGVILNVSSYLTHHAGSSAALPAYAATKGAVSALTRSLAVRHGPQGIRVNAISPALVLTDLNRDIWDGREDPQAHALKLGERYPLRRVGRPEDIAATAVFLASDEAGWITGQEIFVDGGISAV